MSNADIINITDEFRLSKITPIYLNELKDVIKQLLNDTEKLDFVFTKSIIFRAIIEGVIIYTLVKDEPKVLYDLCKLEINNDIDDIKHLLKNPKWVEFRNKHSKIKYNLSLEDLKNSRENDLDQPLLLNTHKYSDLFTRTQVSVKKFLEKYQDLLGLDTSEELWHFYSNSSKYLHFNMKTTAGAINPPEVSFDRIGMTIRNILDSDLSQQ